MTYPTITATYAAVFALYLIGLSGWVIAARFGTNTLHGDGGNAELQKRIRAQGNFTEYVPLALLLIALLEARGASPVFVNVLLIALLVARSLHPIGMLASKNSPRQFACRGGGIVTTLAVIGVAALALLVKAL